MAKAHILYRFWAADGSLLYIGLTMDPGTRWRAHRHTQPWWATVAMVTIEHFPDRETVTLAEVAAIKAEKPKHNVRDAGSRKGKKRQSRRRVLAVSVCPRGCVGGWSSLSDGGTPCRHPCPPWRNPRLLTIAKEMAS